MEYKVLGDYINLVDLRNRELGITNLLGVSIEKRFIPSIANIVGTDLSSYKVVKNGQFAYGPVTSRNGEKISIALLNGEDCIISSSYTVFEVTRKDELDPEYLMLWFSRPEFDRYARYRSHGSVREIFGWDEMCAVELPVPDIEKQRKIVKAYKTITDRIALKQRINDNLAEQLISQFMIFVEGLDRTAQLNSICSFVSEKATFGDLDNQVYVSTENILPNKQGINYFGTTELNDRITPFKEGDVLIANIRPYFKKIWQCNQSGACNADVLCFRADDNKYKYILKAILYQDSFYDYVMSGAKGTKMPRGDKDHIMKYLIPNIPEESIIKFNLFATEIERIQSKSLEEIKILSEMKSYLLTTLSSR